MLEIPLSVLFCRKPINRHIYSKNYKVPTVLQSIPQNHLCLYNVELFLYGLSNPYIFTSYSWRAASVYPTCFWLLGCNQSNAVHQCFHTDCWWSIWILTLLQRAQCCLRRNTSSLWNFSVFFSSNTITEPQLNQRNALCFTNRPLTVKMQLFSKK